MFSIGLKTTAAADPQKISQVKNWVTTLLNLNDSTTIFVTQLECKEQGCPPIETVIALIESGKKLSKKNS